MRPIDADALMDDVEQSLQKNPHKDGAVRTNHTTEHLHFLDLIRRAPTIAPPPNEPLTLEELREMDGKPVFVTSAIGERPMWYIVDTEENELKSPWDRMTLEGWDEEGPYKAYRREP